MAEAHGVRARAAPVHVFPELPAGEQVVEFLLAGLLSLKNHVALLDEPGVQIDGLAPGVKAMIRHDHHGRAWIDVFHDLADELIGTTVHAFDCVAEPGSIAASVVAHWMLGSMSRHIMCWTRSVDSMTPTRTSQSRESTRLRITCAIVERLVQVLHERLLVHAPFVERPRGFGPAERAVVAHALEKLASERGGGRHRNRGVVRLPVHGRDVQLQLVVRVHQQQLRHAVHADEKVHAKIEIDPAAHLPGLEEQRFSGDFNGRGFS